MGTDRVDFDVGRRFAVADGAERIVTGRREELVQRIRNAARPEELGRRLDGVVAVVHFHRPVLQQPRHRQNPSENVDGLGERRVTKAMNCIQ